MEQTNFTVLAIRALGEMSESLYPAPADEADRVVAEPDDGTASRVVVSTASVFSFTRGSVVELAAVKDVDLHVAITDSRVTLACSKYDKGGGWFGFGVVGIAVALTANAISKTMAANRRRGTVLVGHIRYEWLIALEATDRSGWLSRNTLRLVMEDPTDTGQTLAVDLTFSNALAASTVAAAIVERITRRARDNDVQGWDRLAAGGTRSNGVVSWNVRGLTSGLPGHSDSQGATSRRLRLLLLLSDS